MSVLIAGREVVDQFHGGNPLHSSRGSHEASTIVREREASKPYYHLTAPHGWLNDPCGLGFDPSTGLYNLFFQWNPCGNDWGNASWGHASSPDLVSWKISPFPVLTPSTPYDCRGVFTGCLQATDLHGNPGALTIAYTSVKHLPIHFTLPYVTGCETLSLALSTDGGKTWKRQDCNPVLPGPPLHLRVTGWRDPCISTWARDTTSQPQLHGFISGGILGQAPNVFVYTINPKDLRQWQYVGLLVDVGLNFRPSRWSGDFGVNWEVCNFMTLTNGSGESRDFVVMGVEGCLQNFEVEEARNRRDPRAQLWMSVQTSEASDKEEALTKYAFAGTFDHGCLYAANAFWDPQTSERIVYGWITEEDLPDVPRHRQGWSGMISLPRVVRLMTLRNVKRARSSNLDTVTSIEALRSEPEKGPFTVHTMEITPDPRLSRLRLGAKHRQFSGPTLPLPLTRLTEPCLSVMTNSWELEAEFSVSRSCDRVGIEIAHSADFNHRTTLAWSPRSETFTIHRPPVENPKINHGHETAPHTLFTSSHEQDEEIEETLRVHAFFDKSVLEVFVNERTVISTRIYYPSDRCFGIRFFAEASGDQGAEDTTRLLQADAWDGLGGERCPVGDCHGSPHYRVRIYVL